MRENTTSTRRSFLKGGTLLAAPVAATLIPAVVLADEGLKARVKRLEDEAAIRRLHQSWVRQVNGAQGAPLLDDSVRRITPDHTGAPDRIEIAADAVKATGYFDYVVESETPLACDCTLAQMAHAQGSGTLRRTRHRRFTVDYTRSAGTWKIAKVASGPA